MALWLSCSVARVFPGEYLRPVRPPPRRQAGRSLRLRCQLRSARAFHRPRTLVCGHERLFDGHWVDPVLDSASACRYRPAGLELVVRRSQKWACLSLLQSKPGEGCAPLWLEAPVIQREHARVVSRDSRIREAFHQILTPRALNQGDIAVYWLGAHGAREETCLCPFSLHGLGNPLGHHRSPDRFKGTLGSDGSAPASSH